MLKPDIITWVLVLFGIVFIFLPILYAQYLMVRRPQDQKTKDIIIGKDEDWRDKSHLRNAYGLGWADLVLWLPLILIGSIGVILGYQWGYVLWAISGAISVYINVVLWFAEREYVYPSRGPLIYFTYFWGFFVYWGIAVVVYSVWRLA